MSTYARVLRLPGAARFSLTGLIARMPISMMTLGIVLLVTAETGSYTIAGQISATYVIANAVVAVPHGRLLDRLGQRPVLLADSLLFALGCGLLVYGVRNGWDAPWPHAAAALAGLAIPQIGSCVRARWTSLVDNDADRHTAFALEAVADEVVFMVGPTLVTFLATLISPVAGLMTALLLGTLGSITLAAQNSTAPTPTGRLGSADRPKMPWGSLLLLTVASAALGSLFGASEVATVAFAAEHGHPSVAGVLLAIWAGGSLVAGLITGALHWNATTLQRFRYGALGLTVTMAPTPFLPNVWVLGAVLLVGGFAISPTLIALVSRVEEVTPRARLTEALGLIQTGLSAGIAPGAALGGWGIDENGAQAGYIVAVISCAIAALVGFIAANPKTLVDSPLITTDRS